MTEWTSKELSDLRYKGQEETTKGSVVEGERGYRVDRKHVQMTGNKREHSGFGESPNIPFA